MTPTYPKRPAFFANKAIRAMVKTCVAQEHGQGVFSLLCVIAMTEDARKYTSEVTFWNEQLAAVAGFSNVKAMDRQREKAIESGWLVYIPGAKAKPGRYWVEVPVKFQGLDDAPTDEGEMAEFVTPLSTSNLTKQVGKEPGDNRELSGVTTGKEPGSKWATFIPIPKPVPIPDSAGAESVVAPQQKPKPSRRFVPPSVEEVLAYCTERSNAVDPERFVDHYAARGWVMSNGRQIKDWQACVRTWEKNDAERRIGSGNANAAGVFSAAGHGKRGGLATHEYDREAANNAALADWAIEEGILPGDGGAHHAQKNLEFHEAATERVVLRFAAVPGEGGQSVGRGASNVGDAISGGRRPIQALSAEDASGVRPDGG
jgi:hypothetical protein